MFAALSVVGLFVRVAVSWKNFSSMVGARKNAALAVSYFMTRANFDGV